MPNTARLNIPLLVVAQEHKEVAINNALNTFDAAAVLLTEANAFLDDVSIAGKFSVTGDLSFAGSSVPVAAAGADAGTLPPSPVVAAGSNDTRGRITFGTGTVPAAGAQVGVTFFATKATAPFVLVIARNTVTEALGLYVSASPTTGFTLSVTVAPAASQANTVYSFDYFVFG